ncbi:hypothetical protein Hanom_Chr13g01210071 [Helianthus anomalus]
MGKTFLLKADYNQNSALNDPQRRLAPRARLDILGNKIMSGRINMTQAQLTALIQEQVVAALAAAQAGGISCSHNSH